MSITSAFNNAFSGLNASSRRAELISNNISNALTDGFGRREIHLSSQVLNGYGGGVRVEDVSRVENAVLSSARREADAEVGYSSTTSHFVGQIADRLGNPGELGALAVQFSDLENAFINAANDPSSDTRLSEVVRAAGTVAEGLNDKSVFLNGLRKETDTEIGRQVNVVNQTLGQLSELNIEIRTRVASGGSIAALKDQQGQLLDQINSIIPVKVVARDHGRIAIFTPSGGTLLDDQQSSFDFSPVPAMAHSMTLSGGALSSLDVNGTPVDMSSADSLYGGGSLASLFNLRDQVMPKLNDELDALAVDLVTRFQDPAIDPTLAPGDAGIFTDAGAAFVTSNTLGLAGRISLNSAVDPAGGGTPWKLRAGLNAASPGDTGDNAILRGISDAMRASASPAAGMATTTSMSASGFAEQFASGLATERALLQDSMTYNQAKSDEMRNAELAAVGVDTDAELQSLMEVEAAYSANARVMSVLDELLSRLLEI